MSSFLARASASSLSVEGLISQGGNGGSDADVAADVDAMLFAGEVPCSNNGGADVEGCPAVGFDADAKDSKRSTHSLTLGFDIDLRGTMTTKGAMTTT